MCLKECALGSSKCEVTVALVLLRHSLVQLTEQAASVLCLCSKAWSMSSHSQPGLEACAGELLAVSSSSALLGRCLVRLLTGLLSLPISLRLLSCKHSDESCVVH